jgi:hypothetical protein
VDGAVGKRTTIGPTTVRVTSEKEKVVETEYHQSIWISYLATGIACTEAATRALPRGLGGSASARMVAEAELLVEISDFWDLLERTTLVGRAFYEMRARHVLPPRL